jgi:hypothetical protein
MITRWTFFLFVLLISSGAIPAPAVGQQSNRNQSGWRATVDCDALVVYSQMTTQSKVVSHLTKGDIVTIDLEIISAGGTWCLVSEPGKRQRPGYAPSECLDREQTESITHWDAQSPPDHTRPDTEPVQLADRTTEKRATREEIEQEVDRAVASRLKALQLTNETPLQVVQRDALGFDDRTSFLFLPGFGFLPRFGVPFNFPFRHIAPSVTSRVQIRPNQFLRRR